MNRRGFLRTLATVIIGALIAPVTRLLPKRATQLSTLPVTLIGQDAASVALDRAKEWLPLKLEVCTINDQTGELGALCEQIAAEFPNCRTIYVTHQWFDSKVTLYIKFWLDKYDRPLACSLRDTIKNLTDEHRFSAFIDGLRDGIEYWESIGPPYRTETTETSYKAYYTPEQRRRMNQPIGIQ